VRERVKAAVKERKERREEGNVSRLTLVGREARAGNSGERQAEYERRDAPHVDESGRC
jgi:hypothetical protein